MKLVRQERGLSQDYTYQIPSFPWVSYSEWHLWPQRRRFEVVRVNQTWGEPGGGKALNQSQPGPSCPAVHILGTHSPLLGKWSTLTAVICWLNLSGGRLGIDLPIPSLSPARTCMMLSSYSWNDRHNRCVSTCEVDVDAVMTNIWILEFPRSRPRSPHKATFYHRLWVYERHTCQACQDQTLKKIS